ncbi:MAG: CBS domain-containing protein [Methanosarcinales archaeon Met12]|nr:MAG: CBS domain-containing protein [Methanosarcinales archaeon Met12]
MSNTTYVVIRYVVKMTMEQEMETRISVREIMTKEVVTAEGDMRASVAGEKMIAHNVGSLIIVEDGKPVGIVTERDMVRKIISENITPGSVTLRDLMTQPLISIRGDESLDEAARKMMRLDIRRLPVVEENKLVGIVTDTDIIAVSPGLTDILTNLIEMNRDHPPFSETKKISQGICERCDELSGTLEVIDGTSVCESCKDEIFR